MPPTPMKAVVVIKDCFIDANTPADNATFLLTFTADDDPASGTISANISILLSEAQIATAIKQAVVDYINQVRGSVVIAVADVRLP